MSVHDPLSVLAIGPEGDVAAAHACARQLLAGAGSNGATRDARLLLTAVCLHLHTHSAANLTACELVRFLGGKCMKEILEILRDAPVSFLEYAAIEIGELTPTQQSVAFSLALAAAERYQGA